MQGNARENKGGGQQGQEMKGGEDERDGEKAEEGKGMRLRQAE